MRKFILIAILIFIVLPFYGEQSYGTVYVQRNGKIIKTYNGKDLCNALNEAINGDTLYLSKGIFGIEHDEPTEIASKSVTILGAGASDDNGSNIIEYLYFKEDGENNTIRMEGIKLWQLASLSIDIHARKCTLTGVHGGGDIFLDRCHVGSLTFSNSCEVKASNCTIDTIFQTWSHRSYFFNCDISYLEHVLYARFVNCIINDADERLDIDIVNTIINNALSKHCSAQDCYFYNGNLSKNGYTTEWLKENNYLGTDGTVVGCYGGTTPYTLELNQKEIQVKDMKIDTKKRKGTISVSVE